MGSHWVTSSSGHLLAYSPKAKVPKRRHYFHATEGSGCWEDCNVTSQGLLGGGGDSSCGAAQCNLQ